MSDDNTPDDKIVQLFTGEDPNTWVDIGYIKDDAQICSADDVLKAQIGELRNVVLIGEMPSGGFMLASSLSRMADINFLVDAMKAKMVNVPLE